VTAIQDEVEVWRSKTGGTLLLPKDESDKVLVQKLKKGEKIQGLVRRRKMTDTEFMMGIPDEKILSIVWENLESGFVKESAVKVSCVPIDDDFRRVYLPDLPDMEWEPEE
jgi:hypothetical protein